MKSVFFSLILIFLIVHRHEATYDCSEGCDLDPAVNGETVCGDDGIIYSNECFAICQGVQISISETSCPAMNGGRLATTDSAIEVTGFIPISIITQYQNDGFKFVRKINMSMLNGQVITPSYDTTNPESPSNIFESPSKISPPLETLMITSEGYEYTSNHYKFNSRQLTNEIPRSTDAYNPDRNNHRTLKVITGDDRFRVPNPTEAPYKYIGALVYTPDTSTAVCTGTVISKTAILTAAHCVYNVSIAQWLPHTHFAPGRYTRGTTLINPNGLWSVDITYIQRIYASTGKSFFDFAVVSYKNRIISGKNYSIGEYVGHAGLAEVSGFADPLLDNSTITGYPLNRGGRAMWSMGQCKSGIQNATDYLRKYFNFTSPEVHPYISGWFDCDTSNGTDGASMLGSDYRVRGLAVYEILDKSIPMNGGNVFIKGNNIYDVVTEWSGNINATIGSPAPIPMPTSRPTELPTSRPTAAPIPTPCFSSNNFVQVKDIGSILISELTIGDYVLGGNGLFTKVYGFGHLNREVESEFLQIFFEDSLRENAESNLSPLEISPKHLIFVERNNKVVVVPSSDVIVGDVMSRGGKRVKAIRQVNRHGVYAPLTLSGDIMVSGILASNHVQILNNPLIVGNQHMLGELVWLPRRIFCQFFMHACKKETYTTEGYSTWAYLIVWFSSVINRCGWIGAFFVNALSIPFILAMPVMELIRFVIFGMFGGFFAT